MADKPDILIVGAGPAGLTAALELTRRGFTPRIVEKDPRPHVESRALAINPRSMDILEPSGAAERLVKKRRKVLAGSLKDGSWKTVLPGKAILARFVGRFWGDDVTRVRQAYVDTALAEKPSALSDIQEILEHFREA